MADKTSLHYTTTKWDGNPGTNRNLFIGGSDCGTILGLNPWKSPFSLWSEKTGLTEPDNLDDKFSVWFGTEVEEVVAKRFSMESNKTVHKSLLSYSLEEYPFLVGHIDRKVIGEKAGLECKTTTAYNKTDFENGDIPPSHYCQVQFYLLVTGWDTWYYATTRNNSEFHWMEVQRNDDFIFNTLLPALIDFWEHVQNKDPVGVDGSESTSETISKWRSTHDLADDGEYTVLSENVEEMLREVEEIDSNIKALKELKEDRLNNVKVQMTDFQTGYTPHYQISFKTINSNRFDSARFKKEHPDLYKDYLKQSTQQRFEFKQMKEKENN